MRFFKKTGLTLVTLMAVSVTGWAGSSWDQFVAKYGAEHPTKVEPKVSKPVQPQQQVKSSESKIEKQLASFYRKYNKSLSQEQTRQMAQSTVQHCAKYKVDPALLAGIIIVESRANPRAKGGRNVGLCQINWPVHAKSVKKKFPQIKSEKDMFVADNNIAVGAWILSGYLERAGGSETKALGSYLGRHNAKYIKKVQSLRKEVSRH